MKAKHWGLFFFQAEDGIRDGRVTGVQTCALPILGVRGAAAVAEDQQRAAGGEPSGQIGRASCRESVDLGGRRIIKKKKEDKKKRRRKSKQTKKKRKKRKTLKTRKK